MVESRWWASTVAANFSRQLAALVQVGSQLRDSEWDFVRQMQNLSSRNEDMKSLDIGEWTPSARQINYVQSLHGQYCTDRLNR
jgi:hypothetical protein